MKLAFPYMGEVRVALAPILRTLGAEVIVPPPPDREVLELGVRLAPELMCIPFKLTLGNMVRSLELGADTLVYVSGSWSCRFGYYGRLQAEILRDLGWRFRLIELRHDGIAGIARDVVALSGGSLPRAVLRTVRALRLGWHKSLALEAAQAGFRRCLPRAARPGDCRRLHAELTRAVEATESVRGLVRLRRTIAGEFGAVPLDGRARVPKVMLVGESYCTIEPFINFDTVRKLGELGVEVEPFLTEHRWLGFHGFRVGGGELARAKRAARGYWRYCVGGEDENSLGHLILAARAGYDGVIHVHPFGCMPGTVVQPALERAARDFRIPWLSLSLDEHTSEAGFLTRLEAFVSLLERRRP
jgi:predicted nucleotide-binding protein (sugar kinase/HSP70/actin superfamily)